MDDIFVQPIFRSSSIDGRGNMPSKPMIMNMLGRLKKAGILKTIAEGRGPHVQVLALAELVNLCEGNDVV